MTKVTKKTAAKPATQVTTKRAVAAISESEMEHLFDHLSTQSPRREGHYSRLFQGDHGVGLRPYFFEPSVLDKYRDDPNCELGPRWLGTKDGAPIDSSYIQQYVWGHKEDGTPCVVVLLAHLDSLSARDQLHWKAHELAAEEASKAKICHRYKKPMWDGKVPDTISGFEALFYYLREIQKLFLPDVLFPNLPEHQPAFLTPLPYNSKKAMTRFAQDLLSLMSMKLTTLARRIASPQNQSQVQEFLNRQQSRNLLRLYFEDRGQLNKDIEDGLDALGELNTWRVQSAHKLVPADGDKDYLLIASDLVGLVQYGLRAMLLAIIQAEGKTPDTICARVLNYKTG
jgi:hypothetical protein